jgi:hypothetical protein
MKECGLCLIFKELKFFCKKTSSKDGLNHRCKDCSNLLAQNKRKNNPIETKEKDKNTRIKNADKISKNRKTFRKNHPELLKTEHALWAAEHLENLSKHRKKWRKANPNKCKLYSKKSRQNPKNKEKIKENRKKWNDKNRKKWNQEHASVLNANTAMRRLTQKNRVLTNLPNIKQEKDNIKIFYKQAQTLTVITGIKHEVDHIIPLQGKNVSGLHVSWNMQILTKEENRKKNNKLNYKITKEVL